MTWAEFNRVLMTLSEAEVKEMLDAELAGKRRKSYLVRLHKRYNMLRVRRERQLIQKPR